MRLFRVLFTILVCIVISNYSYSQKSISGLTWLDTNENGIREGADNILPEVRVELYLESGMMIQFTDSDNQGNYTFEGLTNGNYYLKFIKKQGLNLTLRNVGNDAFDSDIFQTGFSRLLSVTNTNSNLELDAGFSSSIIIKSNNLFTACQGESITINPIIEGYSGTLNYSWSHDNSAGSSTTLLASSNIDIILTVTDQWNLPVSKKILVKVTEGLGVTDCQSIDLFTEHTDPIDIWVSKDNPGPNSQTYIDPDILGGSRRVTIELLDGENISSVNSSNDDLFISNCSGCRTSTSFHYSDPNGGFLDLSFFDFMSFTEVLLDQGNIDVTITLTGENGNAILIDRLESEGPTSEFDKLFFFGSFNNAGQMDLSRIISLDITLVTTNVSIDFKFGSIFSCFDKPCEIDLNVSEEICLSDSITLSPTTDCEDGLIYQWASLGFGREKTVSPTETTTYTLTVFDQNGCSSTFNTSVIVNQPPTASVTAPLTVCEGDSTNIAAAVSGNGPFTYEWNITNENISSYDYTVNTNTFIDLLVTDNNGCTATAQKVLTVIDKPEVSLSTTRSRCSVPTGSVTATITGGNPPYTVNWSNGVNTLTTLNDIESGTYEVTVTDANGCIVVETALVENLPCAEIGNYVWHDVDFDGIQGSSDIPLSGVIVLLLNAQNQEISRDTTDVFGHYLFSDLEAGNYYVQFGAPDDFYPTVPNGTTDITMDSNIDSNSLISDLITLSQNEKNLTIDAGWYQKACIGDQVWSDINLNDVFDNLDTGISDIKVKLYDCNQSVIDSTTTDIDGNYQFCNLDPGSYSLTFCDYDGYMPVTPDVGDETIDSDIDQVSASTPCKAVMSGDTLNDCDAGFILISSIGDYVWHDLNADGIQDNNEPPLSGIVLNLYNCDDTYIGTTSTNNQGQYLFDSLTQGSYYVEIVTPDQSILSSNGEGNNPLIDSDFLSPTNRTDCIDLPIDTDITTLDAGLYYLASIGDYAWIDSNLNGVQDNNEQPIEGLKIYLHNCTGELLDSTLTNGNGYYIFDQLFPDSYYITVQSVEGQSYTTNSYQDDTVNSDIDPTTLASTCRTLVSEENHGDLDVGIYFLGKIGDYVWYDDNGNGIQDFDELGVPDVSITLLTCNEEFISTTTTDTDGNYCFQDIPYGDYIVQFDIPEPYFLVTSNSGNDDSIDSDPNTSNNRTDCFTLDTPSETTIDAGINTCSEISGVAWFEISSLNDIQDPFENGVNGVKVKLYQRQGDNWVLFETAYTGHEPGTASDDGYWEMCVPPGEYYAQFSDISILEVVEPNVGNDESVDSDATHAFGINTTDIIQVNPGVSVEDIGIGYRWQTSNKVVSRYMTKNKLPTVRKIKNGLPLFTNSSNDNTDLRNAIDYNFTAHPNPTNDIIYLTSDVRGEVTYSLFDSAGNVIKKSKTVNTKDKRKIEISIEDKVPGMYYILIETKNHNQLIPIIKI